MVCPIIDVISDDTFEYMAGSDMTYGGFNWKLNFRWYPVPQREMDRRKGDRTLPVRWVRSEILQIVPLGGNLQEQSSLNKCRGFCVVYLLVRSLVTQALELVRARQSSPLPTPVSECP